MRDGLFSGTHCALEELIVPAALLDKDLRPLQVNPAFAANLEYRPEALCALKPEDWIHPQDIEPLRQRLAAILKKEEKRATCSVKLISKNGQFRYTDWHLLRLDEAPESPCVLAQLEDKTQAKRYERSLYEAERAYEELFNATNEGIAILDPGEFFIRNVNSRMARMFGHSPETLEGMQLSSLAAQDAAHHGVAFADWCHQALHEGAQMFECQGKRADNSYFWVEVTIRHAIIGGKSSLIAVFRDVEARRRSESTLRNSEERYRSLFKTLNDAVLLLSEGSFVDCNPKALEIFGSSREQLIGHQLAEFSPSEQSDGRNSQQALLALKQSASGGSPQFFEWEFFRQDGAAFDAEVSLTAIVLSEKEFMLAVLRDITERKAVEAALLKSEEELENTNQMMRLVLDTIPVRVFWKDKSLRYMGCNQLFAQDAGLEKPEEIFEKTDFDLFRKEDAQRYRQDDHEVISKTRVKLNYEELQGRNENDLCWLRTSKVPLIDRKKNIVGILGIYEDITARKAIEEERIRLSAAIEQAAEDIVLTDKGGRILYVNPAFEKITGYTKEEAVGNSPRVLKSGKHEDAFYADLWETITKGEVWKGRITNKAKNGRLFQEDATISPIKDKAGEIIGFVALKRDVTEEVHLENQLHQAQKMEAVGQLAGGVAHDFNNLLQAIQGYTDMALYSMDKHDPNYENLTEVLRASERATTLIRQLLTFSRREALQPQVLNINDVIGELLKLLGRVLGEHIELAVHTSSAANNIYADPGQLEQVLMNLCVNARDAMPNGGTITIETENTNFDEEYCEVNTWARPGDYVALSVSDSGIGIPPELSEHIFEPFFTTKEIGEGTGLGLATVYAIVRRHEGMIHLYSELGEGTRFQIYFPALEEVSRAAISERPVVEEVDGGSETILIAEDDPMVRKLGSTFLEQAGYSVILACDGEEAIRLFEKHKAQIDGVLLDVIMPKCNGRMVYDAIRKHSATLPILFSSGYSYNVLETGHLPKENVHLIAKPYRKQDLLIKIRQLLDEKKN